MSEMMCQYCGQHGNYLGGGSCSYSTTGKHVLIHYHDGEYTCQHCGQHSKYLGGGNCSNSPTGRHVLV